MLLLLFLMVDGCWLFRLLSVAVVVVLVVVVGVAVVVDAAVIILFC